MAFFTRICAFLLVIALFSLPYAFAQDDYTIKKLGITFDISQDNSVKQATTFDFGGQLPADTINYTLSDRVRNIEVYGGDRILDYLLEQEGDHYNLRITLNGPTDALTINYTVGNLVFISESVKHFFTELSFAKPIGEAEVKMMLPEGYVIYQNSFRPADSRFASDGKRIILDWNGTDIAAFAPLLFSAKFISLDQDANITLIVLIVAIGIIVGLYPYTRRRMRDAFLHGFSEDEKKTIAYLEQHKTTALQSDLEKEFKFSRAKTTRIVSKLTEKGLVRKQKYGRTNRLHWLK